MPVQFGFFFNLDGDPGCDPQDPATIHSQGLEAIANVSGHELSETLTDPRNGGWIDRNGEENADKCAWTFSGTVAIGGQQWKIQGNWSNAAYNASSGYDHAWLHRDQRSDLAPTTSAAVEAADRPRETLIRS